MVSLTTYAPGERATNPTGIDKLYGLDLRTVEVRERLRRAYWVTWYRCELSSNGETIYVTPKRLTRAQALEDGRRASLKLSALA